ncbi:L-rhamnose mutarotase [Flagellimonas sp. S3867]|uniref:L-rhamnose mutarotase n=1 Tax=Flagellimonas sp. S3867 TaxID=2768063 RepID=UPI001684562F|nr:L-rhamnose mutarotase [Flagellimonas sp. S3867]
MKRYALALDLKDDPNLIAEYEAHHMTVWPEIKKSILDSGIERMEIYRLETRLFMIIEADEHFSFQNKAKADLNNPKVQEWEELMWKYQQALPMANPGEKWLLMKEIFRLEQEE